MFYYITGEVACTEPGIAVIDCGGIGYKLTVSSNTLAALSRQSGKVKLFTYLSVREDALELFGFYDLQEHSAFRMLISVSGIGPKAAMSILSQLTPEKFALAVISDDTKAISKAPGVGAKTAARVVLELKDKISREIDAGGVAIAGDAGAPISVGSKLSEAQNALLVLGYSKNEALTALRGFDTDALALEDIIREALKRLMRG